MINRCHSGVAGGGGKLLTPSLVLGTVLRLLEKREVRVTKLKKKKKSIL